MKLFYLIIVCSFALMSCSDEISKEDFCGHTFGQEYDNPYVEGVKKVFSTTINCDGTFSSSGTTDLDPEWGRNGNSTARPPLGNFSGTWEMVTAIPDSVMTEIKDYGMEEGTKYTVISYKSSNNYFGYCLLHKVGKDLDLSPLVINSDIRYIYGNKDSGVVGIYGGFRKK